MNGWDFAIVWQAGRAVLQGQDPYGVEFFYYPLPIAYLFAPLAALPRWVAFAAWLAVNLGILVLYFRRDFWKWMLYFPVIHLFSSGQIDLALWGLGHRIGRTWPGAVFGALLTLKPQVAVVLLPWHLFDWLRNDRKMLLRWAFVTLLLWGLPALWRPAWIRDWLTALPSYGIQSLKNVPGVFSLAGWSPALIPALGLVAVIVFVWGLFQSEQAATRAACLLASPIGLFYATLCLLDSAPWWLLVPVSWLATGLTLLSGNFVPFMLMPVSVLVWHWRNKGRSAPPARTEGEPSAPGSAPEVDPASSGFGGGEGAQ